MGDTGLEPVDVSTLPTRDLRLSVSDGGAECGAVEDCDPELATLIEAWPRLPAAIKAAILAIVRSAGETPEE